MDWTQILAPALGVLSAAIATILAGVGAWALYKFTGIKLDDKQQSQAQQIILGIEEKAMAAIKAGKIKTPGVVKHADAIKQLEAVAGISTIAAESQVDRAMGVLPTVGATTTPQPNLVTGPGSF